MFLLNQNYLENMNVEMVCYENAFPAISYDLRN